jgi:broad specificity phosphatase PhoE
MAATGPRNGRAGRLRRRGWQVRDRDPGPQVLWLVRHGESMGNVADAQAHESGAGRLSLDVRDPDVELSDTGRSQAEALGKWLAEQPEDQRPTATLSSPFNRALTTCQLATANLGIRIRTDERLRERDFGAFDGMTGAGIRERYPEEAERRDLLGKFYYRPPGGESWADVALRIRGLLASEGLRYDCERLLVVAHQAVIMVFRYVLEELTEQELLEVDRDQQVANASLTRYDRDDDGNLRLTTFNEVEHLVAEAEEVTEEPDAAPQH